MELQKVKTCDLVKELENREGIQVEIAEPYQEKHFTVNGPAKILIIVD